MTQASLSNGPRDVQAHYTVQWLFGHTFGSLKYICMYCDREYSDAHNVSTQPTHKTKAYPRNPTGQPVRLFCGKRSDHCVKYSADLLLYTASERGKCPFGLT